jgi:hypothetical protein
MSSSARPRRGSEAWPPQQLSACIQAGLEQYEFARPVTPQTSVSDAYADDATSAVVRHLIASGWLITNAPGDWSWGWKPDGAELKELLRSSVRYPLLMAQKPPRRRGEVEMRDHRRSVAEDVARHLLQGGWTLAPALAKKAPIRPHSTPMTRA